MIAAPASAEPAADTGKAGERGEALHAMSAGALGWRFGGSAALVADAGTLPGLGLGASRLHEERRSIELMAHCQAGAPRIRLLLVARRVRGARARRQPLAERRGHA